MYKISQLYCKMHNCYTYLLYYLQTCTELDFNTPMSRITRASLRSHSFSSSKLDSPAMMGNGTIGTLGILERQVFWHTAQLFWNSHRHHGTKLASKISSVSWHWSLQGDQTWDYCEPAATPASCTVLAGLSG